MTAISLRKKNFFLLEKYYESERQKSKEVVIMIILLLFSSFMEKWKIPAKKSVLKNFPWFFCKNHEFWRAWLIPAKNSILRYDKNYRKRLQICNITGNPDFP